MQIVLACSSSPRTGGQVWAWLAVAAAILGGCGSDGPSKGDNDTGCATPNDCGSGSVCLDRKCQRVCRDDSGCSAPRDRCDPVVHVCVSCLDDSHCTNEQFCTDGECQPDICVPGEPSCDPLSHARRVCLDSGGDYDMTSCSSRQSCVLESRATSCQPWVCTAGAATCDADHLVASVCAPDGLSQLFTDCGAAGQHCLAGACIDTVCEPDGRFCKDGNSYLCSADGNSSTINNAPCSPAQFCNEQFGTCSTDLCSAGEPVCDGTIATTCLPDGSGPAPDGTDCASVEGDTCVAGDCLPILCNPSLDYCDPATNSAMVCSSSGTYTAVDFTCFQGNHCDPATVTCQLDVCRQGGPACVEEVLATCNADGSAWSTSATNCADSGRVCSLTGSCVDADLADIGVTENITTETMYVGVNAYYFTKNRRLTRIEQRGTAPGSELTWLVYEGSAEVVPLDLVFQTITTGTSDPFQSSGNIDLPMKAGSHYWIGLRSAGTIILFRNQAQSGPIPMSFGEMLGSTNDLSGSIYPTLPWPTPSSSPFYQRLTLTAPSL